MKETLHMKSPTCVTTRENVPFHFDNFRQRTETRLGVDGPESSAVDDTTEEGTEGRYIENRDDEEDEQTTEVMTDEEVRLENSFKFLKLFCLLFQ